MKSLLLAISVILATAVPTKNMDRLVYEESDPCWTSTTGIRVYDEVRACTNFNSTITTTWELTISEGMRGNSLKPEDVQEVSIIIAEDFGCGAELKARACTNGLIIAIKPNAWPGGVLQEFGVLKQARASATEIDAMKK